MDIPEIDVDELERHLNGGARVFDVREPDEYGTAHIPGTTLMPLATVPDNVEAFGSEQTAYIVCARGGRSAKVVEFLRVQGVDAVNVAGGIGAWVQAGKPTVAGSQPD